MVQNLMKGIFIFSFALLTSFLQSQSESKLQTKGEAFLNRGMYDEALEYFSERDEKTQQENPLYNYYMAMVTYNMPERKKESTQYFEDYLELATPQQMAYYDHYHVHYMLGKMYHLNYEWDKAEEKYNEFLVQVHNAKDMMPLERQEIIESTEREIEHCKFGRMAINNPRNVILESLGDSINTKYPEYASVVSQDEERLIFTSRRPDTRGGGKDKEGGYFEDIYSANLVKGSLFENKEINAAESHGSYFNLVTDFVYTDFQRMNDKVNSLDHDGSIQLGSNGNLLYFYRDGNIWSYEINDTTGMKDAQKLGVHINSDGYEPSIFFSYDREKLFIISNRKGGYGGLDIYMSKKMGDNVWSEPENLGPNINTPYDEDAPYLDPDGKTLYFSTRGHSSMGGYDVFRSRLEDDEWTVPVNMGFPVNTPADDIYFTMTTRYNRGYYSSSNLDGKGDMDLYRITFSDERDPVAELMGLVKKGGKLIPARSKITLTTKDGNEAISQSTDTIIGDYFLLLGHGKTYTMTVETEQFAPYTKEFVVPEQKEYFQLFQEIHHVHLTDSKGNIIGQQITVFNATGEEKTSTEYYSESTINQINNIKDEQNISDDILAFSDVKFYIPEDSLRHLMKVDPNLIFDFDENVDISFLRSPFDDPLDPNSYLIFPRERRNEIFLMKGVTLKDEVKEESKEIVANSKSKFDKIDFKVQIGLYSKDVTSDIFEYIEGVELYVLESGLFKYSSGNFTDYQEAVTRKLEIQAAGIKDAFIVAYVNGERVPLSEALEMPVVETEN